MHPILHVPIFHRLSDYVGLWAMEENSFRVHWEAVQKMDLSAHVAEEQPPLKSQMEMVPARGGKSTAVVPILGVMMKQRSSMGGTSTIQLRRDIRNAAADPNVSGILLAIESPGGTTAGLDDLAAEVRAAGKAKPVWAHIDDLTASAAYWAASQAERITANSPTALVGSIGTILTVYDQSALADKEGVKALVFATGPLKGAGTPGTKVTEEQQAYFQGLVNGLQTDFDAAVKRGRKLTDAQLRDVRSGGVWKAPDAQAKKLIDGIQPLAKTLDELGRAGDGSGAKGARVFVGQMAPAAAVASDLSTVSPACAIDISTADLNSAAQNLQTTSSIQARPLASGVTHPGSFAMDFAAWLSSKGFKNEDLSDASRAFLEGEWKASQAPPKPPVATVVTHAPTAVVPHRSVGEIAAAQRAENDRCQRIQQFATEFMAANRGNNLAVDFATELANQAIDGQWDVQRAELAFIREGRNFGSRVNFISRGTPEITGDVLEAAVCQSGRLENMEKHFDARTLEAAQRRFRGGIGLQELLLHFAARNGFREMSTRNLGPALRAAFQEDYNLRAEGPTTYSLPGILSNVANKFLRVGFDSVENVWRSICFIRSVSDFKQISSYTLTGDNTYEKVAPSGELKHGNLGEVAYHNQADTYGKILGIDRRDLINDDLGALTGAGRRLGRGGALKLNDVVWGVFLDNSAFFTAGRGNADSGNDTLMDLTGIANAENLFTLQTDPDGKPIGTMPAIVLVPTQQWPAAWTLLMSTNLNLATSTAASTGTQSPWTGMFRIVKSVYLANSSFTGYSATAWYLLADPNDLPVIEVCFLNGVETPTVETADADFDRLGIAMRGFHDFGASLQEYRGGVRMAGA